MSPFFSAASSRRKFLKNVAITSAASTIYPALGAAREISPLTKTPIPEVKPFDLEELPSLNCRTV